MWLNASKHVIQFKYNKIYFNVCTYSHNIIGLVFFFFFFSFPCAKSVHSSSVTTHATSCSILFIVAISHCFIYDSARLLWLITTRWRADIKDVCKAGCRQKLNMQKQFVYTVICIISYSSPELGWLPSKLLMNDECQM